jgi:hypothetical protein
MQTEREKMRLAPLFSRQFPKKHIFGRSNNKEEAELNGAHSFWDVF